MSKRRGEPRGRDVTAKGGTREHGAEAPAWGALSCLMTCSYARWADRAYAVKSWKLSDRHYDTAFHPPERLRDAYSNKTIRFGGFWRRKTGLNAKLLCFLLNSYRNITNYKSEPCSLFISSVQPLLVIFLQGRVPRVCFYGVCTQFMFDFQNCLYNWSFVRRW